MVRRSRVVRDIQDTEHILVQSVSLPRTIVWQHLQSHFLLKEKALETLSRMCASRYQPLYVW